LCQILLQQLYWELAPKYVKYYAFVTFLLSCPVLSYPGYTFFSDSRSGRTPGRILTVYDLNDASSPDDVPFGDLDTTHNFKGFKPPKTQKGGVVRHFPAKLAKL